MVKFESKINYDGLNWLVSDSTYGTLPISNKSFLLTLAGLSPDFPIWSLVNPILSPPDRNTMSTAANQEVAENFVNGMQAITGAIAQDWLSLKPPLWAQGSIRKFSP